MSSTNLPPQPGQSPVPGANTPMHVFAFSRMNYILMFAGIGLVILGFLLMSGTTDIYNPMKITVAPIIVLLGFGVEAYAIMYKPKRTDA